MGPLRVPIQTDLKIPLGLIWMADQLAPGLPPDTTGPNVCYCTDVEGNWEYLCRFVEVSEAVSFVHTDFDTAGTTTAEIHLEDGWTFVFGGDAVDKGPEHGVGGSVRVARTLVALKVRTFLVASAHLNLCPNGRPPSCHASLTCLWPVRPARTLSGKVRRSRDHHSWQSRHQQDALDVRARRKSDEAPGNGTAIYSVSILTYPPLPLPLPLQPRYRHGSGHYDRRH